MKHTYIMFLSLCVLLFSCESRSDKSSSGSSPEISDTYEETTYYSHTCPNCGGVGVYGGYTCIVCGGTGYVQMDQVETKSRSNVSFRGTSYTYGPCNSCKCQGYVHKPGNSECESCKYFKCTTNKFGHKKIYN